VAMNIGSEQIIATNQSADFNHSSSVRNPSTNPADAAQHRPRR
jgi:hypothetical protein